MQIAGHADQAEQLATEARQLGADSRAPDAGVQFGLQLITISTQRGALGDLAPAIEQTGARTPDRAPALLAGMLAMAHADADRIDEARLILEQFAASGFDLPLDTAWLTAMCILHLAQYGPNGSDPAFGGRWVLRAGTRFG